MSRFQGACMTVALVWRSHAAVPTIQLNNGVEVPVMALGTVFQTNDEAQEAVTNAIQVGMTHIDTAYNYKIQEGVGAALAGRNRSSFFVTTKVPTYQDFVTYDKVTEYMESDLQQLGLDFVDLMLLHYPLRSNNCELMREHWRAAEDFYKAGKARAIGVSNYCSYSLDCILATANVVPAVNQLQLHVGMGPDPAGLKSYTESKGIVHMAYSPLAEGTSELITGELVTSIGAAHNKTGAQVALSWVAQLNSIVAVKSASVKHLVEDLDIFDMTFTEEEEDQLDFASSPAGKPSNICTEAREVTV